MENQAFIAFFLVFLGTAAVALVILLLVVGVFCIPVVGPLCGFIAWRRGYSVVRHFAAGSLYSPLLLFPAIYLIFRLLDKEIPTRIVRSTYGIVYGLWLLGPLALAYSATVFSFYDSHLPFEAADTLSKRLNPALLTLNLIVWIGSLVILLRASDAGSIHSRGGVLLPWLSLIPFVFLIAFTLLLFAVNHAIDNA